MGRWPRHHAYFVGDNYDEDRNALLRVLEGEATAGLLVHPTHGERNVVFVGTASFSWQRTATNFESVSLTFAEVGDQPSPVVTVATAELTTSLATATNLSLGNAVAVGLNTTGNSLLANTATALGLTQAGLLQSVVSKAGASVAQLGQWTTQLQVFQANMTSLIANPVLWVANTLNVVGGVAPLVTTARQALGLYQRLHALLPAPQWGFSRSQAPARVQLNTNNALQATVWRVAALTHASQQAVVVPYTSRDEALATRNQLTTLIQGEIAAMGEAIANPELDEVAQALGQLQASLVTDLTEQALRLQRFETLTLGRVTPALVLAYDLYDDPTRADEIVAENRVANPNALPANTPLRVLTA